MSRLTLPNGDWADFDSRMNYAQARRVKVAEGTVDFQAEFVCALVRVWAIRDVDDQPIEFPERGYDGIPLTALDRVPFDTYQAMAVHAASELEGIDPKDTGGTSIASSQELQPSKSRRTSQKRSSSKTIQDGVGRISSPPLTM